MTGKVCKAHKLTAFKILCKCKTTTNSITYLTVPVMKGLHILKALPIMLVVCLEWYLDIVQKFVVK